MGIFTSIIKKSLFSIHLYIYVLDKIRILHRLSDKNCKKCSQVKILVFMKCYKDLIVFA